MIPTADSTQPPEQPRGFSYEKLLELSAQSIGENGLLHPVTVTFRDGVPVLVAGERRLRAAKIAGIREIPCIELEAEGVQRALLTLVENLQRQDMNCFETAEGMHRLIDTWADPREGSRQSSGLLSPPLPTSCGCLSAAEERSAIIGAGLTERHRPSSPAYRGRGAPPVVADIEGRLTAAQSDKLVDDFLKGKIKRKRPLPVVAGRDCSSTRSTTRWKPCAVRVSRPGRRKTKRKTTLNTW